VQGQCHTGSRDGTTHFCTRFDCSSMANEKGHVKMCSGERGGQKSGITKQHCVVHYSAFYLVEVHLLQINSELKHSTVLS